MPEQVWASWFFLLISAQSSVSADRKLRPCNEISREHQCALVVHGLPRPSAFRRTFHCRAVNTVYKHKGDLLQCFENISDSDDFDHASIREAGGLRRLLEDETFSFFQLFHLIMPHVDILYSQFQKRSIDMIFIGRVMQEFMDNVQKIRVKP